MLIQTLVSESTVARLDEGIVGGLARARKLQLHPVAVGPRVQGLGDELWTVVDGDPFRPSNGPFEPLQDGHDPLPSQGDPDLDGWAHPTHGIDYRQDPEAPPVGQAVAQEIHAPPLLGAVCWW